MGTDAPKAVVRFEEPITRRQIEDAATDETADWVEAVAYGPLGHWFILTNESQVGIANLTGALVLERDHAEHLRDVLTAWLGKTPREAGTDRKLEEVRDTLLCADPATDARATIRAALAVLDKGRV